MFVCRPEPEAQPTKTKSSDKLCRRTRTLSSCNPAPWLLPLAWGARMSPKPLSCPEFLVLELIAALSTLTFLLITKLLEGVVHTHCSTSSVPCSCSCTWHSHQASGITLPLPFEMSYPKISLCPSQVRAVMGTILCLDRTLGEPRAGVNTSN